MTAVLACPSDKLRASLLEQVFSGRSVGRDGLHMGFDPGNFGPQRFDPSRQLILRERAKILLEEQGQRILRLAGKEVILVHAHQR